MKLYSPNQTQQGQALQPLSAMTSSLSEKELMCLSRFCNLENLGHKAQAKSGNLLIIPLEAHLKVCLAACLMPQSSGQ